MNTLEADVLDVLTRRNVRLIPQYGVSKYRIDFAVAHPRKEGQFLMALECDGSSYHSSPTAMERDRIRQSHLEALGWRFHRIWSSDWFYRKEEEIDRFLKSYKKAIKEADHPAVHLALAQANHNELLPRPALSAMKTEVDERDLRPTIEVGEPIDSYSDQDIGELILWIMSDGKLRTDDEIINEVVVELEFSRKGKRIVERIKGALRRLRSL